jgi:hypothetical protein
MRVAARVQNDRITDQTRRGLPRSAVRSNEVHGITNCVDTRKRLGDRQANIISNESSSPAAALEGVRQVMLTSIPAQLGASDTRADDAVERRVHRR